MSWLRRQWLPLTVLVIATAALIATMLWIPGRGVWPSPGGWWSPGAMMGGGVAGDGPVPDLAEAERAAERFAQAEGLRVGEVMEFDNEFYAELVDSSGASAIEVLVDRPTGAIRVEWGPAMMWNTADGVHPTQRGFRDCTVHPDNAQRIANDWLRDNRPGETTGHAEAFPGYYTLHTERDGDVVGMLSVHCTTRRGLAPQLAWPLPPTERA